MKTRYLVLHLYFEPLSSLAVGVNVASPQFSDDAPGKPKDVARFAADASGQPYLPASGVAGALRDLCRRAAPDIVDGLFGCLVEGSDDGDESDHGADDGPDVDDQDAEPKRSSVPSVLDVDDGVVIDLDSPENLPGVLRRTRTVVDRSTGASRDGLLFTVEELDPAPSQRVFVRLEVDLTRDETNRLDQVKRLVGALRDHGLVVGSGTRSGYGVMRVAEDQPWDQPRLWAWIVDVAVRSSLVQWLRASSDTIADCPAWADPRDFTGEPVEEFAALGADADAEEGERRYGRVVSGVRFDLDLVPVEPYLSTDKPEPDSARRAERANAITAVTVAGERGVRGSAVKGSMRSRAERVVRTAGGTVWPVAHTAGRRGSHPGGDPVAETFGHTDHAGLVTVHDAHGKSANDATFTFVAIDRFTSGAREDHLFTVTANAGGTLRLSVDVELDHRGEDAWLAGIGQVLLVLLDVATGDLPLGGLTRRGFGTFHGTRLSLTPLGDDVPVPRPPETGWSWGPREVGEPWETPKRSDFIPAPSDEVRSFLDDCVKSFSASSASPVQGGGR